MLAKRIIPCLDVDTSRVVKDIKFVDLRDAGGPVEVARRYNLERADEILLTSMDRGGTRIGFDLVLTRAIAEAVPIPVIASGGVGTLQNLVDGGKEGPADAVLVASIFHFAGYSIGEAKRYMADRAVEMRL